MSVMNKMNILSEHFVLKADSDFELLCTLEFSLAQVAENMEKCHLLF